MTTIYGGHDQITCPNCGTSIPVSEALSHQIAERARAELKAESLRQQTALAAREKSLDEREKAVEGTIQQRVKAEQTRISEDANRRARDAVALELEDLKRQATEKDHKLSELQNTELELRKQKRELEEREKTVDLEIQRRLEDEKEKVKAAAEQQARSALSVQMKELQEQAAEKDSRLAEAQTQELELLRQNRALQDKQKTIELEIERKIQAARARIREDATKELQDTYRLKDAEKEKKLQDALRVNEELHRKLQQGSQQIQGEVLELELEQLIRSRFPFDEIEPVPKGICGADIVQKVISKSGLTCGTIIWESKRTKAWNDGWLSKLKDDQRSVKADIAVIVSETLPKGCKVFGHHEGVWVSNAQCAVPLAGALRSQLIEVAMSKMAAVGKNEKMEILYQYLSGPEFRQRVEAIVEAFVDMQNDLQDERRVTERRWAKREKQIQRVIANTSGMYGDFQGLIGSSLQTIPLLTVGDEVEISTGDREEDERTAGANIDEIPF